MYEEAGATFSFMCLLFVVACKGREHKMRKTGRLFPVQLLANVEIFNIGRKLSIDIFILNYNYIKYLERKGHSNRGTIVIKIELEMLITFR